jgi:hypothetical protein
MLSRGLSLAHMEPIAGAHEQFTHEPATHDPIMDDLRTPLSKIEDIRRRYRRERENVCCKTEELRDN